MKNSKFLKLAAKLDRETLIAFNKYIKKLHKGEEVALSVFDYIRKLHPDLEDHPKLEISRAYLKIFNESLEDNPYNRTKLLNALSDLHLWLKDFLLLQKMKDNSFESLAIWGIMLKKMGLQEAFERHSLRLRSQLERMGRISVLDYMKGMVANYFFYYHLTRNKQEADISSLQDCSNDMDLFYAVSKLKIGCEMANRKNLMARDFEQEPITAVIELLKAKNLEDHLLLHLYLEVYRMIEKGEDRYACIEQLLTGNIRVIEPEELHTILSYMHNYASARIRKGHDEYWKMVHNLNKFTVAHGVFAGGGELSSIQFNNVITAASISGDFKWADVFMNSHKAYLNPDVQKNAITLAKAVMTFEKKAYKKALNILEEGEFRELFDVIRSRSLALRCLVELKDPAGVDIVEYCISFEGFLKRQKKRSWIVVKSTLNFIRMVEMIEKGKAEQDVLLEQINSTAEIFFKPWLIEKAKESRR
ncbi:MAG: hypothetical protein H6562_22985 [Lewinellaceae bacterium]|nr:hypothetical protein [Lewinellaceae bacterium]